MIPLYSILKKGKTWGTEIAKLRKWGINYKGLAQGSFVLGVEGEWWNCSISWYGSDSLTLYLWGLKGITFTLCSWNEIIVLKVVIWELKLLKNLSSFQYHDKKWGIVRKDSSSYFTHIDSTAEFPNVLEIFFLSDVRNITWVFPNIQDKWSGIP